FGAAQGDIFSPSDPFAGRTVEETPPLLSRCTGCHEDHSGRIVFATAFSARREEPVYATGELKRQVGDTLLGYSEKPALVPTDLKLQVEATTKWAGKTFSWGLLQGM